MLRLVGKTSRTKPAGSIALQSKSPDGGAPVSRDNAWKRLKARAEAANR